ncbi:hypothetical protein BC835DRAFT_1304509 [Cytidiella melzeri]|nr:hypothetical protein BC835DRAFT_1304509 [Cytidiella melzeri]
MKSEGEDDSKERDEKGVNRLLERTPRPFGASAIGVCEPVTELHLRVAGSQERRERIPQNACLFPAHRGREEAVAASSYCMQESNGRRSTRKENSIRSIERFISSGLEPPSFTTRSATTIPAPDHYYDSHPAATKYSILDEFNVGPHSVASACSACLPKILANVRQTARSSSQQQPTEPNCVVLNYERSTLSPSAILLLNCVAIAFSSSNWQGLSHARVKRSCGVNLQVAELRYPS